jgi:guanine nucleotide-binding protein subunit beta-2-like 1 protein
MKIGEEEVGKDQYREFLLSGSRDNSLLLWDLYDKTDADEEREMGKPRRTLKGHSHFVSDIDIS